MKFRPNGLFFLAGIILCSTPSSAKKNNEEIRPWDQLPMSMYVEQGCLKDSNFIKKIDFDNFDNIYLMDRFHWKSQNDFDTTIDGILASDGEQYRFSKDNLFRFVIDEAHKVDTKVIGTFGNDMVYGALDDTKRAKLVKAMTLAVRNYDLDGVDIDWEVDLYPNIDKHTQLLYDLRQSLDSLGKANGKEYSVSTAMSIKAKYPDSLRSKLNEAIDWINIMSYDMGGCLWRDNATHNTPMKLIADCIDRYWYDIPRHKLHLGLASYGFIYTDILPGEKLPNNDRLYNHGRYAIYTELVPYIYGDHPWRAEYDPIEKSYYFINPNKKEFITVETPETIVHKFNFANEAGLGGTFWWEYCKDIVADNNGGDKWKHILVPTHKKVSANKKAKNKGKKK